MKLSLALLFSFLVVASARADFYSDNNPADVWINALNPSYTGEFTLAGYNPAEQAVIWANAEFTLWDLIGNESVKVGMGDQMFTNGSFSGFLHLGGDVLANALAKLDNTGALSYTVSRTSGGLSEFWLKNARIDVRTSARSIPDSGSTSVLAGLGLLLVISARRWLSRGA